MVKLNGDPLKAQPQIRITLQAHRHIVKVVNARKARGFVVNLTSIATEAVLAIPLVPANIPQPQSVEKKRTRKPVAMSQLASAL